MYNNRSISQSAVDGDQDQQKVENRIKFGTKERGSHSSSSSFKAIALYCVTLKRPRALNEIYRCTRDIIFLES